MFWHSKILDICSSYGVTWNILFNPEKSHAVFFGVNNPEAVVQQNDKTLNWSSTIKYLGVYLTSGTNFRTDLNIAKQKYHGCFNNIKSVVWQKVNELMICKLVKMYCLGWLLYGCET